MITVKRFTASWCAPCRMLAPTFTDLAKEMPEVQFETIDIDIDEDSADLYGIRSVPMVIILNDSEIVNTIVGVYPKQKYVDAINTIQSENTNETN